MSNTCSTKETDECIQVLPVTFALLPEGLRHDALCLIALDVQRRHTMQLHTQTCVSCARQLGPPCHANLSVACSWIREQSEPTSSSRHLLRSLLKLTKSAGMLCVGLLWLRRVLCLPTLPVEIQHAVQSVPRAGCWLLSSPSL